MQDSDDKKKSRNAIRYESHLYGDEGELPIRPKKKKKTQPAAKKAVTKKKKTHKFKLKYKNVYEWMNIADEDGRVKPIRIFGHDIRFWPIVLLGVIVFTVFGIIMNNGNIEVKEQDVTVVGLPENLEGYRILVVSDLNGKRFGDEQHVLLKTINNESYDILVCVGDMVGASGDPEPFYEMLEGLSKPEKVYFICGDSDPGPLTEEARSITGTLDQIVLEDWILGAIERGANYVDSPISITVKNDRLWLTPATMLNLETSETLASWKDQTEQEEDGTLSGIDADYDTLPFTSYRYRLMQELYDAQRDIDISEVHISLAHEPVDEDFIYTMENRSSTAGNYLSEPDLIIAGHYCGGVWNIPLLGAFYVSDSTLDRHGWFPDQSRVRGLSAYGESQMYITGGLHTNSDVKLMPFRLFNKPEITMITLTSKLPTNLFEMAG